MPQRLPFKNYQKGKKIMALGAWSIDDFRPGVVPGIPKNEIKYASACKAYLLRAVPQGFTIEPG